MNEPIPVTGSIGLLGGSFDPVHAAHLVLARCARDRLQLAQVRLMPAGRPWQKPGVTPAVHRVRMLQYALAGERNLVLDTEEVDRDGPTYTMDTLHSLRRRLGPRQPLVLILGGDQLERLDTWRRWQEIPLCAHLAVAHRNAEPWRLNPTLQAWVDCLRTKPEMLHASPAGGLVELDMPASPLSGTALRTLLHEAGPQAPELVGLLPRPVLDYIAEHRLYR
jgi:nicotinate-nucleotide adenylyltransferase